MFEENFRQVYDMKNNQALFQKVVEILPTQAQELGFLEIRQQSLKLRELGNIEDKKILELYNLEFLENIKIWIQTAKMDKKGFLLQAIQNLLINMIKVTNDMKYNPYHL